MREMRMNSLKSRAMNCGPLSGMIRGLASRYFSLYVRSVILTEERFLQFQLRRDTDLVHLRASQINGYSVCVDMGLRF
jgi:hypothetical protein